MALPNPLASRWGRLMAFFFLYVTEGIPLGFTATTMASQMKRAGVGETEIGLFVGSLYLPWGWKWIAGPFVDVVYSNRIGARRGWILGTQILMMLSLLACMPIELSAQNLTLITVVVFIHNMFCATQDVAIDSLACNVLHEDEMGQANGLMFAGQTLGIPLGGACVLYLLDGIDITWMPIASQGMKDWFAAGVPLQATYAFVMLCILLVTVFVAWPMREEPKESPPADETRLRKLYDELTGRWDWAPEGQAKLWQRGVIAVAARLGAAFVRELLPRNLKSRFSEVQLHLADYVLTAGQSFFRSRAAFFALIFALLPPGAVALNLALQKTVAVEIGYTNTDLADLEVVASIVWAVACILGGFISDRLGHLKCLAVFLAMIAVPTYWCAWKMQQEGMIHPQSAAVVVQELCPECNQPLPAGGQATHSHDDRTETTNERADKAETTTATEGATTTGNSDAEQDNEVEAGIFQRSDTPPMAGYFWWAVMAYMVCQGLMYGTRTAIFMRIANPDVAATQFTAYMAMMNLVTAYSAAWQGYSISHWGYPITLFVDATFGLACIAVLPFLRTDTKPDNDASQAVAASEQ